jgi:predicted RNA binding protein YcfA (HicA-like mRNA interferase family)
LKVLKRAGFYVDHQKGSHVRLIHGSNPKLRVTIPQGTLKNILQQAGMSVEEFIRLLE